jgi:hypothetical protein
MESPVRNPEAPTFKKDVRKERGKTYVRWVVLRGERWIGEIEVEHLKFRPRSFELIGPGELKAIAEKIEAMTQEAAA